MKRHASQQATIVALTQAEIMLVIVAVVLILFLFKSQQQQATAAELERVSSELDAQARNSPGLVRPADLDREVTQKLVDRMRAAGLVQGNGKSSQELVAASIDAALQLLDENRELDEPVNQMLREAIAASERERRRLEKAINQAVVTSGIDGLGADPGQAVLRLAQATADLREVGFIPCWRGSGKPAYYVTFNLTYLPERKTYQISAHADWAVANEVVHAAVNGGIPALAKIPAGELPAAALLAYGKEIAAQKEASYGAGCRLATTINRQADGTIVNGFIYQQLGLYPVWR